VPTFASVRVAAQDVGTDAQRESGKKLYLKYCSQCHGEKYRATAANDLDGEFKPTFEKAKMGTPLPGLQADYRGKSRALNGKITVGAVNAGK
jgi:mono/diheme cytochrome c family protein